MSYFSRFMASVLFACLFLFSSSNVFASGYMLNEYSVTSMGRAFAGLGIVGDDLSAIASNPAGLGLMKEKFQIQAGASFVSLGATFEGSSSMAGGATRNGNALVNIHGIVPNFFAAYNAHDRVRVGLGVYAPFGLVTDYDENSMLNYFAVKSDLMVIEIAPTVSIKIVEGLYFGATANIQYGAATLTQMMPAAALNPALTGNANVNISGSDWAVGGSAGLMYDTGKTSIGDSTRIGFAYRSQVAHNLKGKMEVTYPGLAIPGKDVTATMYLPDTFTLSFYQKLNAPVGISASVRYIMWSIFKELAVEGSGQAPVKENWQDTFSAHIGADWFINEYWTLRLGFGYDMTPVKNAKYMTARLPDNDRYIIGVGMSFMPHKNWVMDVGYSHILMPDRKSENTHFPFSQTGTFKYNKTGHVIGFQAQFKY